MSEQGPKSELDQLSHASIFFYQHVAVPKDYTAYVEQVTTAWRDRVVAEGPSEAPRGFWLRTNGVSGSVFGAHINFLVPRGDGFGGIAAIDIADDEVQVWQPKGEGSDEPVVTTSEAYTLPALGRAIDLIEQHAKQLD
ncbi:MAG: hypothetical protein ABIR37_04540 [Candidatus Saccharimonadales bacterium]